MRRRIAEEFHDIGIGIAAWYCEAAAEKGEEVNPALIVFQKTKKNSGQENQKNLLLLGGGGGGERSIIITVRRGLLAL